MAAASAYEKFFFHLAIEQSAYFVGARPTWNMPTWIPVHGSKSVDKSRFFVCPRFGIWMRSGNVGKMTTDFTRTLLSGVRTYGSAAQLIHGGTLA